MGKKLSELALFGGSPVRSTPWPSVSTVGDEEKKAVLEVLDSGVLSDFVAAWGNHFQGGERVKRLEGYVRKRFGVAHYDSRVRLSGWYIIPWPHG